MPVIDAVIAGSDPSGSRIRTADAARTTWAVEMVVNQQHHPHDDLS
jgi:hypothetical protein